jgi:hypothetical protein
MGQEFTTAFVQVFLDPYVTTGRAYPWTQHLHGAPCRSDGYPKVHRNPLDEKPYEKENLNLL